MTLCSEEDVSVVVNPAEVRLEVASAYPILPNKREDPANNSLFQPFSAIQGLEYLLKQ